MQEKDAFCLQCQHFSMAPSNRLVQDSCGHKKCRSCLLNDVDKCKQCLISNSNAKSINCHTAVIQCNGKAKLNCDKLPEKNGDDQGSKEIDSDLANFEANLDTTSQKVNEEETKNDRKVVKKKTIAIPSHVTVKSDPVSYFCTVCDKTFLTKAHVKYHQYCAGEFKPYKCDKCVKQFITKAQLNLHTYNHSDTKPFSCATCQKSFTEKSKLTRHMLLHSTEKKYICPDCAKSFKSRESLRVHALIHKNEKPYSCKVCDARFNNSSNLKKHLVSHTDERAHMCDTCGRRFKLKWALSVHKKSHLKLRPHQCRICSRSFVNHKDLQRHNLIHTESKGYACGICRTGFRRKDNLHRHMKNSHPGKTADVIENPTEKPVVLVDNPNAINVITTAPQSSAKSTDSRPSGSVINGPIKLAFKTPAFKSHYNIARDCDFVPPAQIAKPLTVSETIEITNQLLPQNDASRPCRTTSGAATSTEICQKILSLPTHAGSDPPVLKPSAQVTIPQQNFASYSSSFHYETSFQNRKHAMIKNIKFKVPEQYTNLFKQNNNTKSADPNTVCDNVNDSFSQISNTSVIVNSNHVGQSNDLHWRRRTSQNLVLKN